MKSLFIGLLISFLSVSSLSVQSFMPLSLQGYNHDVIAEGTGRSSLAKTTMAMDAVVPSNNVICTKQFAKANSLPAGYGIPDNGVMVTKRNRFNLLVNGGNNALFVRKGQSGELTLNTPTQLYMLSILGLATEGAAVFNVTLHFADFTKLVYRQQIFPDWFDGPEPFYSGFGRIKRVDASTATPMGFEGTPNNPNMYTIDLNLPKDKILASVTFQNISTGENIESNRLFIFAFAGVEWKQEVTAPTTVTVQKPVEEIVVVPIPVSTEVKIEGEVRDAKTNKPIQATIQFTGNASHSASASATGNYSVTFPAAGEYAIKVEAPGYVAMMDKIDLKTSPKTGVNFLLTPIEKGTRVNLKNVLFQQGTPTLLSDSYKELDLVVDLMKANPSMRIELAGHTDNVGSPSLNMKLSNYRVTAVKKYLVDKGIDPKRVKGKGYGSTKPIAPGNTEEARKLNRRVEFVITQI